MSRRKKRLHFAREEDKQGQASQKIVAKNAKSALKPKRIAHFGETGGNPKSGVPNKKRKLFDSEIKKRKK